jgi:hypothetical protein
MVFQWQYCHYPRKLRRNVTSGNQLAIYGQGAGHFLLRLRK